MLAVACRSPERRGDELPALRVAAALGTIDDAGFARALEPRAFTFPRDHGPHSAHRTEWWYLTGNLETTSRRHFGYQATFFRTALTPRPPERRSAWATNQIYMAHFALTDTAADRFSSFERFGRGAQGLAGAHAPPLRVWLEDWELAAEDGAPAGDLPPLRLRLGEDDVALDLRLVPRKPLVLHGDRGLSPKGTLPGNASYYYSSTRLETVGTVRLGAAELAIRGWSWMDREWSTSLLEEGTAGWDWLALQLDDGSDLMYFRLRDAADGGATYESGTRIDASGAARGLARGEVLLEALGEWQSPATGTVYPSRWRLRLPGEGLDLELTPRLPQQELVHTFVYWEGAVEASGRRGGEEIRGQGYVELTGYAAATPPR